MDGNTAYCDRCAMETEYDTHGNCIQCGDHIHPLDEANMERLKVHFEPPKMFINGSVLTRKFKTTIPSDNFIVNHWDVVKRDAEEKGVEIKSIEDDFGKGKPVIGVGYVLTGNLLDLCEYIGRKNVENTTFEEV